MNYHWPKLLIPLFLLTAQTVQAADLLQFPFSKLSREDFRRVSRDVGVANSFPVVDVAEPYGLPGFDIGLGYQWSDIPEDKWPDAVDAPDSWNQSYVRVVKGLPANIDIGIQYGRRIDGNESVLGGEIKFALLEGSAAAPAFGVRLAATKMFGSDMMDLRTLSAQAEISKGFPLITPFAGAGATGVMADPKAGVTWSDESESATIPHLFGGVKISPLPFLSVTVHGQYAFSQAPLLGVLQISAGL